MTGESESELGEHRREGRGGSRLQGPVVGRRGGAWRRVGWGAVGCLWGIVRGSGWGQAWTLSAIRGQSASCVQEDFPKSALAASPLPHTCLGLASAIETTASAFPAGKTGRLGASLLTTGMWKRESSEVPERSGRRSLRSEEVQVTQGHLQAPALDLMPDVQVKSLCLDPTSTPPPSCCGDKLALPSPQFVSKMDV